MKSADNLFDKHRYHHKTLTLGAAPARSGSPHANEPATADAEHTAHQADCVIDSMGSYEVTFGPHVFAAH